MSELIKSMQSVKSKDGTLIAYDRSGEGPAVILVDGALQYRAFDQGMAKLGELLASHFSAIHYDRRGRGDSGDTLPYSLEREIEDIEALIDAEGGKASVYGISSGACLALEAALQLGNKVKKLALYEAPYSLEGWTENIANWHEYTKDLKQLLSEDRKADAVGRFMKLVGATDEAIAGIRQVPDWLKWEAVATTLVYDAAAMGQDGVAPLARASQLKVPTLVMAGGASEWPIMRDTAEALAKAIPNSTHRVLDGQTHEVSGEVLAPVLIEFFNI